MLAHKKSFFLVFLLMALCVMFSAALADGELTVEALDATILAVRWEGASSDRYSVSYAVQGTKRQTMRTVVGTEVMLFDLAPATTYEIEVRKVSGGTAGMTAVATTPAAANFRDYNFKREGFNVYLVEDYYSDFWDNERIALDSVDRAEFEEILPDYFFVALIDKTWDSTAEDKHWEALIVMRTPDGGVYTRASQESCDGSWDSLSTFYDLSEISSQFTSDAGKWLLGTYTVELYMDGQFAGRASFTLKDIWPSILDAQGTQQVPVVTEAPVATSRLFAPPLLVTAAPATEAPTAPPTPEPTAAPTPFVPAFGNLNVRVNSPVSATITWDGPIDDTYVLILGVGGRYEAFSLDAGKLSATVGVLIPGTDYEVTIYRIATDEMLDAYITTPEANAFRTNSYRWNVCRVYAVNEANASFWENGRKRVEHETVAGIKELRRQGRLNVILDFWWEKTSADKVIEVTLAMRTPEGYLFYLFSKDTFNKSWEGAYFALSFEELVDEYLEYAEEWSTGTYQFEIYFNDQFAGRTSFTLN